MFKRVLFAVLLLFPTSQLVLAHDAWIVSRDGKLAVIYGHGARHDPYDPQKLKDPKGIDSKGAAVPVEIMKYKENASLVPEGNAAIVTVLLDNGYWVKTTDGWKNIPKREAQKKSTVLASLMSRKYAKTLLTRCKALAKPMGMVLEIVPEKDPFSVKPGGSLPVKVLLNGKPLEGVVMRTGDAGHSSSKKQVKTDKDGKASVPIAKPGVQAIFTSYKTPLKDDPDADDITLSASLTFDLK